MQKLPIDVMFDIAERLAPQDVWSLSRVCKQFGYLTHNETIAKAALEKHAAYSIEMKEARQSGCYAQALRRRVKLQDAVTTAKPYSVGIVAWADQYIYCNGMLCYTQNETKEFFLLNLHQSVPNEIVINVDELLATTNQTPPSEKYELRPIHYSDNILSWLYIPLENTGRNKLFVTSIERRVTFPPIDIDSHQKLFVRNNSDYLYCGTYPDTGNDDNIDDDDDNFWKLQCFNIGRKEWLNGVLELKEVAGPDIGATAAFEIFGHHFYAASSVQPTAFGEDVYLSRYYGVRYPLGICRAEDKQLLSESMFRRDHREGPIDDRWSTLSLEKNPKQESLRSWSAEGNTLLRATGTRGPRTGRQFRFATAILLTISWLEKAASRSS